MLGRTGGKQWFFSRTAASLLAVLLFVPAAAFGEAGDFLPSIYSSSGSFDLNMSEERNENTVNGRGAKSSDSFAAEHLRLSLDGFVFHPRFIIYTMRGAMGLSQERYDNNQSGYSSSDSAGSHEYDLRMKILPEHPYNLELYTFSSTPLLRRTSADMRPTNTEDGAVFNYAKKPFFLTLSHNGGKFESRVSTSEYRNSRASGSYFIGPLSNSAVYSHTDASTSSGIHVSNDLSSFENIISGNRAAFTSRVSERSSAQSSLFTPGITTDTFSWTEQFNAQLPWHFSTSAAYNLMRDTQITDETAWKLRSEEKTTTESSNFTIAHKLYDSVRTSYTFNQSTTETSRGDTSSLSHSISGIYTKRVPDGRVTLGVIGNRSIIAQHNAPLFLSEPYSAPLFGSFAITREGIDPATIVVKVLDDSGALVDLVENLNYILEPSGNTVQVTIIMLPPQISLLHPLSYKYSFRASYTLVASTVEFETTTAGYNINLTLFNNLINPYFSRTYTVQEILAGSIPGGARDSDSTMIGITLQKAPYSFLTEERIYNSDYSPSRTFKNSAQYARRLSETLYMTIKAERTNTVHGRGTLGTNGYTETITSLFYSVTKHVPEWKLNASLNTNYSLRRATIDTTLYGITGLLSWRLGVVSMEMGTTISRAESTGVLEKQTMMSELYYFNLSRKLF